MEEGLGKGRILVSEPYIEVRALRRDLEDSNWGVSIKFINRDKVAKEITIPYQILEDQKETIKKLVNEGFNSSRCNGKELINYLQSCDSKRRIIGISRPGWIIKSGNYTNEYICPLFQAGPEGEAKQDNLYELKEEKGDEVFGQKGTLEEWQEVCRYCENNHIPTLLLCVGLSGICSRFIPTIGTTIINLVGKSSIGKTTGLQVAGSVWGSHKFIQQWRATSNALESVAEMHNDGLLILDELSQVSSKDIGSIVYMLGNEQGKKRMTSDINIRRSKAWRMSGLSSGEIGIADKIEAEKGAKARAGQLVRCLDIDAQVSEEYGIYTNLHGFHSGAELSNYLKEATSKCYGTAAEEFVKRLLELPNPEGTIRSAFEDMKKNITERFQLEEGVSGQVQRIADAFALYAAVGTLASSDYLGVFTHNAAGIEEGVFATFESWLKDRGGKTSVDEERVCDAMVDFLAQNDHRFYKSQLEEKADQEIGQGAPVMIERINLPLGYKESEKEKTRYYIYPNLLKKEFYSENGFGVKTARKILAKQGLLATDHKGNDPVKHKDGLKQRLTTIEIPCISQESANQMKEWKKDNIP